MAGRHSWTTTSLCAAAIATGCAVTPANAPPGAPGEPDLKADTGSETLPVPVEAEIEFCPDAEAINLVNALSSAQLSGNAYASFENIARSLEALGFGGLGEGESLADCFAAADRLFDGDVPSDECFLQWSAATGVTAADPIAGDRLLHYLVGEAHPGWGIEVFSDASFDERQGTSLGSTQVFFARHATLPLAVISFRGTSDLSDGLVDAAFLSDPFYFDGVDTRVHGGFWGAVDPVDSRLRAKIDELPPGTQLWITGHSLGAALATLFAARIMNDRTGDGVLRGLVTFGSPRPGNPAFARTFEDAADERGVVVMRVQNHRDPVTHMPPSVAGLFFQHVSGSLYFDERGELSIGTTRAIPPEGVDPDQWEREQDGVSEADYQEALARLGATERGLSETFGPAGLADLGNAIFAPHAITLYHGNLSNRRAALPGSFRCEL